MSQGLLLLGRPAFPIVLGLVFSALIIARWLKFNVPRGIFLFGLAGIPTLYLLDLPQTLVRRDGVQGLLRLGDYLPPLTVNLAPYLFTLGVVAVYAYPKRARITWGEPYALLLCLAIDYVWFSLVRSSSSL